MQHCDLLSSANEPVKKRRKSRWASDDVKTQLPGLPTVLPANMTEDQQKLYLSESSRVGSVCVFVRVCVYACVCVHMLVCVCVRMRLCTVLHF